MRIAYTKHHNEGQISPERDTAIAVSGSSTHQYAEDITIEGNYIEGFSYKGIIIGGYVRDVWVVNNVIKNMKLLDLSWTPDAIAVGGVNVERVHIIGNKIINSEYRGLFISNKEICVEGNQIYYSGDYPIWIDNGDFITVRDNYIYGAALIGPQSGSGINVKEGKHIIIFKGRT